MGGSGVIDNFLAVFTSYIDSGFGLLGGEVAFIATTLIVIDVTLAALFWAWGADDDIIARLVKKTIFVGVFAWLITNWNTLARIVFDSFAGLGLMASGTGFSAADLMRPGRVAQTGMDAGRPLLESISDLMGWVAVFENLIQILCLFFAWALVILAFFILAVQLFVTLIEFKLTTLAGFVLIPFGLFGKTAFMAERVLGNVVSSGIKVLVLAVIVGIGSTLFSQFTVGFGGVAPTVDDAMAIVLAALSLLGLGIFGPGIATGLVSGGPQLGAGLGAKGGAMAVRGGAATAGAASAAYSLNSAGQSGIGGALSGATGVGKGAGIAALSPLRKAAASISASRTAGVKAAFTGTGGSTTQGRLGGVGASVPAPSSSSPGSPPAWAQRLRGQSLGRGATVAAHAVRSGDSHGPGASVSLSESDKP